MVLKKLESRLERAFDKTLSRPFKSSLQPIEIGARIVRELDLTRRLSSRGPISPNHVKVWLSPADAQRFDGFQKALVTELEETVRQHALNEGYSFVGPAAVQIFIDDDVKAGDVKVEADFVAGTRTPQIRCSDGRTFDMGEKALIAGRNPEADIVINDSNVSRRHAEFWRTTEGVAVKDLGSTNGTFVNGHRIEAVSLSAIDEVVIGDLRFRVELA